MEKATDYITLWRQLVEFHSQVWRKGKKAGEGEDYWQGKAASFDEGIKRRLAKPDSQRDILFSLLKASSGSTVLDIGAGTGGWAIPMAHLVEKVTAVEPSVEMIRVLRENLDSEGIHNVEIIQENWPSTGIQVHDFALCSHAMYGCSNLPAFLHAMTKTARRTCLMLIRAPNHDGIMAKAATRIWGQPNDSPNFQVAYNVMLQIGIYPHVLMGDPDEWDPWTSTSHQEALAEMKQRLGLESTSKHDTFLLDLLQSGLTFQDGKYVWPREVRSALLLWNGTG